MESASVNPENAISQLGSSENAFRRVLSPGAWGIPVGEKAKLY